MVFFTCNSCGESLKKNKVPQHLSRCRSSSLTCVDCQKDFTDNYISHNQCISEDQKYGGLNYQPKEKANKGKAKQEEWITKLKSAIDNFSGTQHIKQLMRRMMSYDNIPRKKQKFKNFVRSCLRVTNDYYIEQMWGICEGVFNAETVDSESEESSSPGNSPSKRQLNGNDQTNKAKKLKTNGHSSKVEDNNVEEVKDENSSVPNNNESVEEMESKPIVGQKLKIKRIVVEILNNRENHEISLKKLRKKVIKKYLTFNENYDREDVGSKFDQRINCIKKIVIDNGRVSLK